MTISNKITLTLHFWCIHPWIIPNNLSMENIGYWKSNCSCNDTQDVLFEHPLFSEYLYRKDVKSGCFCWKLPISANYLSFLHGPYTNGSITLGVFAHEKNGTLHHLLVSFDTEKQIMNIDTIMKALCT